MRSLPYALLVLLAYESSAFAGQCKPPGECVMARQCTQSTKGSCKGKGLVCCPPANVTLEAVIVCKPKPYEKECDAYHQDAQRSIIGHLEETDKTALKTGHKLDLDALTVVEARELFAELMSGHTGLLTKVLDDTQWDTVVVFGGSPIIVMGPNIYQYGAVHISNQAPFYVFPFWDYDYFLKHVKDVPLADVLAVLEGKKDTIVQHNDALDYAAKAAIVASLFAEGRRKPAVAPRMARLLAALAGGHLGDVQEKLKQINLSNTAKIVKTGAIHAQATPTIGGFIHLNAMCQARSTSFRESDLEAYFDILLK